MEWVVTTARTVEEARESALDELGVDEQEADVEVLEQPQKGLFGRLRVEAKVRARVRPTVPRPKVDKRRRRGRGGGERAASRGRATPTDGGGAAGEEAAPPAAGRSAVATAEQRPEDAQRERPARSRSAKRRRRRGGSGNQKQGAGVSEPTKADAGPGAPLDIDAQRSAVETFLTELLEAFGRPDATVAVAAVEDETLQATIDGPELGLLVGQKGVTLQALQELVRSMIQRRFVGQSHARIRVDVAGYRERRAAALERFTQEVARSVIETGTAKALDPMGPADRKIVHDTVNEIDGVETVSEGEDPGRRVVIRPV
ncbi:MAG TPA: RNA-binding cell elongation regulator Jag/EloR [Acidimicrobiales bacterium]